MQPTERAVLDALTGVAHELRKPLLGITSAAQLLRFRVQDDPVVEKNVGRILRDVERLNNMASALLEYGRRSPLHLVVGDPDAVWDTVIAEERGRLESRALLLPRTRAASPARCAIDAAQLAHAFTNVLVNAVEAAPEGSDLRLHSSVQADGSWRCRLTNEGPPIPADVLPQVFGLFFSTRPGASGIGLAVSQRIVSEHTGSIAIESGAEDGTTVTIVLPPA